METTIQTAKQVKTYYRVHTIKTSAPLFSSEFRRFDVQDEYFNTTAEVKQFLKEQYGNCKRSKMYRETNWSHHAEDAEHIGWIYHFRNKDWSHNSEYWNQQDWVTVEQLHGLFVTKYQP